MACAWRSLELQFSNGNSKMKLIFVMQGAFTVSTSVKERNARHEKEEKYIILFLFFRSNDLDDKRL